MNENDGGGIDEKSADTFTTHFQCCKLSTDHKQIPREHHQSKQQQNKKRA